MSNLDGLIVGLLTATTAIAVLCLFALMAVIENLKDVKAYHFTVIDQLGRLVESVRDGNLRILKCLNGDSYEGSFGGMDVYTYPDIPPGGGIIFNPRSFPPDQEEAHA